MLILASASPRRALLLRAAGIPFTVIPADVDEAQHAAEVPTAYVERLAREKARAVSAGHSGAVVLGADTTVTLDGEVLGKPADAADAESMLARLSGRAHQVHTGVALAGPGGGVSACETTTVWFDHMTPEDIRRYVETGDPMDKAGAYAIQGRISRFIARIEGSYTNVVGLPVALVYRLVMRYPDA